MILTDKLPPGARLLDPEWDSAEWRNPGGKEDASIKVQLADGTITTWDKLQGVQGRKQGRKTR